MSTNLNKINKNQASESEKIKLKNIRFLENIILI